LIKMRARRLLPLAVTILALPWLAGCQPADDAGLADYRSPDQLVLRTPEAPRAVPDVELQSPAGGVDSGALFADRWTLLYVGYSYCPDICPTELGQLSRLLPALEEALPEFDWQVVFLSVDPERDTPAHLARYTAFYSEAFRPVTGERESIDAITSAVRAGYRIEPHEPGELSYNIDHDTSFRLIDPQGRMLVLLPAPHDVDRIVDVLGGFMQEVVQ
jgi:protein SCO1/2